MVVDGESHALLVYVLIGLRGIMVLRHGSLRFSR